MPMEEYVYSVLLVSASEAFNTSCMALLPSKYYSPVDIVQSISHAKRRVAEKAYDLIIINTPLPDDFGRKFAVDVCTSENTVAMLLVKNDLYAETYSRVLEHGVLTLRKPITTSSLNQALDWMRAIRRRLGTMEKKTVSLEKKMSEIRMINRAKWALIESCKMTEADAHRFIEKQAMDRCVTKLEIAENILQTYK